MEIPAESGHNCPNIPNSRGRKAMAAKKRIDIENLVLNLLVEKPEISLRDVAQASGLSKSDEGDRKAIRRVLNSLIARGLLEAKGAARARAYVRTAQASTAEAAPQRRISQGAFKDIRLSQESRALLNHVSPPRRARSPVRDN